MQFKTADLITIDDVQALLGAVPESRRLEYKERLPGRGDDDKAEFLKDVTALANTDGGDIVYGLAEDPELATASHFVPIDNGELADNILRLNQVLQTGVRPRVPAVQMVPIAIDGGTSVLLVRVPQSRIGPHQVIFRQSYRFYGRATNGTYIIEVDELREKILRQAAFSEQVRSFRRDRVGLIRSRPEDMPFALAYPRKLVMHFVPEETFGRYDSVDVSQILASPAAIQSIVAYAPTQAQLGTNYRPNLDGVLFMSGRSSAPFGWYIQVFNDGSIEFVDSVAFYTADQPVMYPAAVEADMFGGYAFAVRTLQALGIQGRFHVLASALGVGDLQMILPGRMPLTLGLIGGDVTIGRDPAFFNEAVCEDMTIPASKCLYPIVAQLWRACAFTKPHSYDDKGQYQGSAFYG